MKTNEIKPQVEQIPVPKAHALKELVENDYIIVSLVMNNVIERTFLFKSLVKARDKFVDLCREYVPNFRDTDIDLALEREFWTIQNGSININIPIYMETEEN